MLDNIIIAEETDCQQIYGLPFTKGIDFVVIIVIISIYRSFAQLGNSETSCLYAIERVVGIVVPNESNSQLALDDQTIKRGIYS